MTQRSQFQPSVYIVVNHKNGSIYTGVSSDLPKRIYQHREGQIDGFTKKHNCKRLVWFEIHATMDSAIVREKKVKGGSREKKIALIEDKNSEWRDLFSEITS